MAPDTDWKLGDVVFVRGQGRVRRGIIDKLTPTRVHVRYTTTTGKTHVKVDGYAGIFASEEAYLKREAANLREYEERQRRMREQPLVRVHRIVRAAKLAPKEENG